MEYICQDCGNNIDNVSFMLLGQAMCYVCGRIVDITDQRYEEDEDNERDMGNY